MDTSGLDDAALVRLIAGARPEALSELYDRYARLVFSLALHTLGDSGSAEEVTQDVFLRIWQKAESYQESVGKVSTWLSSIARNRAIDVLRKRSVRPEGHLIDREDPFFGLASSVDGRDPEESAQLSLEIQKVHAALKSLPPEQGQALLMAYFYGYSHSQIAIKTGEPLGTVKTRIRNGMQKLRHALQEQEDSR
jgi:RNA polymerase sigma-70 factor (ECF subfamily)